MSQYREVYNSTAPVEILDADDKLELPGLNCDAAANLANLSLQTTVEQPYSQSAEISRKQIIDKNLKVLRKRFGDEFVKGERLETGGYADGGARELLAVFLEQPDAAQYIKGLIPNRYQALQTLQDNSQYIIHILHRAYSKDDKPERVQPQDPYELAKNAGYELTGPFEAAAELEQYKQDFRSHELLCTYDHPETRLSTYHISWLRRPNASEIIPADELTEDSLCDNWKSYLRANKRYDSQTDSYDLSDLQPAREDPYGTSSMSVQVSRHSNHVSIKNRYNHSVANPDNTYSSNLDNISYGLKLGLYHRLGREDLYESSDHNLDARYVSDNDGGIHRHYYERNNRYLGHYEYIENGVVTSIDKGAYDMISPEFYVGKNQQAGVIISSGENLQTKVEALEDGTRILRIYDDETGKLQQTFNYNHNQVAEAMTVHQTIAKGATVDYVVHNQFLEELSILEGAKVSEVHSNPALTELNIDEKATVGLLLGNQSLKQLNVSKEAEVDRVFLNYSLSTINLAESARVNRVTHSQSLLEFNIGQGAEVSYISENASLTELNIGNSAIIGRIIDNPALSRLAISEGAIVDMVVDNSALTEMTIHNQAEVDTILDNSALSLLNIGEATKIRSIDGNPALTELNIAKKAVIERIIYNESLSKLIIPEEATVDSIYQNSLLSEISLGRKVKVDNIKINPSLTKISIGEGASVNTIRDNENLTNLTVSQGAEVKKIRDNHPDMIVN